MELRQPVYLAGEGNTLALSTLDATADAIFAERVPLKAEVKAALASLAAFTETSGTVIYGPRNFQLWAVRRLEDSAVTRPSLERG